MSITSTPPADSTIVRAAIHPGIGVARVGNSPEGYYIGPEVLDPPPMTPGELRDPQGALKREAARFRIYGYNAAGDPTRAQGIDEGPRPGVSRHRPKRSPARSSCRCRSGARKISRTGRRCAKLSVATSARVEWPRKWVPTRVPRVFQQNRPGAAVRTQWSKTAARDICGERMQPALNPHGARQAEAPRAPSIMAGDPCSPSVARA